MLRHCGRRPELVAWIGADVAGEWLYACPVCAHQGWREDFDPDPVIEGLLRAGWPALQHFRVEHQARLAQQIAGLRAQLRRMGHD